MLNDYNTRHVGPANQAEEIARARGCVGVYLGTISFQAPDFYRRHGYTESGRIDGYPPGHTRHWFMKKS
jgi:hypothetical protein